MNKMKYQKLAVWLCILLAFSCSLGSFAAAQTRVPGVSVGDSFKYSFELNMNVSDSQLSLPSLLEGILSEAENINWVSFTVTQVSGTKVTLQTTMQFKNGTQQTGTNQVVDVATGQDATNQESLAMFLIAANLNAGDQIYTQSSTGTINETIQKTYPSGTRELNHQSITQNYNVSQDELTGFNISGSLQQSNTENIYWDKQTGALEEMSYTMTTRSQQINADISLNINLLESNVYTIPEFPATTAAIFTLLIALTAAIIIERRHHNTKINHSTTTSARRCRHKACLITL